MSVFQNKDQREIKSLIKKNYKALARYISEIIKFPSTNLLSNNFLEFKGVELLKTHLPDKKHVILLASHLGNWELSIPSIPLITNLTVHGVYKPLSNKLLDRYIIKFRSKFGLKLSPMEHVFRKMKEAEQREIFVFINDQSPPKNGKGSIIDFFDMPTKWYNGIEKMNQKFDCSFIYMKCKPKDFGYKISFEKLEGNNPLLHYVNKLQQDIKNHPSFWLWSHKRWKGI